MLPTTQELLGWRHIRFFHFFMSSGSCIENSHHIMSVNSPIAMVSWQRDKHANFTFFINLLTISRNVNLIVKNMHDSNNDLCHFVRHVGVARGMISLILWFHTVADTLHDWPKQWNDMHVLMVSYFMSKQFMHGQMAQTYVNLCTYQKWLKSLAQGVTVRCSFATLWLHWLDGSSCYNFNHTLRAQCWKAHKEAMRNMRCRCGVFLTLQASAGVALIIVLQKKAESTKKRSMRRDTPPRAANLTPRNASTVH